MRKKETEKANGRMARVHSGLKELMRAKMMVPQLGPVKSWLHAECTEVVHTSTEEAER
jgi:hypothetical protein